MDLCGTIGESGVSYSPHTGMSQTGRHKANLKKKGSLGRDRWKISVACFWGKSESKQGDPGSWTNGHIRGVEKKRENGEMDGKGKSRVPKERRRTINHGGNSRGTRGEVQERPSRGELS